MERAPHIAEEPKCIDAAHCQDGEAQSQPQETGILATQTQLLEMPAVNRSERQQGRSDHTANGQKSDVSLFNHGLS